MWVLISISPLPSLSFFLSVPFLESQSSNFLVLSPSPCLGPLTLLPSILESLSP